VGRRQAGPSTRNAWQAAAGNAGYIPHIGLKRRPPTTRSNDIGRPAMKAMRRQLQTEVSTEALAPVSRMVRKYDPDKESAPPALKQWSIASCRMCNALK